MKKLITLSILCLVAGAARSKEIPEYCLENNAVQHYVHDFVYDDDDYSYTNILDYCDPEPDKYYKYDGYRRTDRNLQVLSFRALWRRTESFT